MKLRRQLRSEVRELRSEVAAQRRSRIAIDYRLADAAGREECVGLVNQSSELIGQPSTFVAAKRRSEGDVSTQPMDS